MTNAQLIAERWKFTDSRLEITDKDLKNIFRDIKDELLDLFNQYKDLTTDDLNKKVSDLEKRKFERKKKEWEDETIITPYFRYLIQTSKMTYASIIQLYIFAIYLKYQEKQFDEFQNLVEITIVSHIFERELKAYGFNNVTTVIHEMKQQGYLNCEVGKNYRRRTINVGRTKCIVIIPKNQVKIDRL